MHTHLVSTTVPLFTPKPIAAETVPQHPYMASNGRSNMHNDAYMSDTYNWAGPNGGRLNVIHARLQGESASVTFDKKGRLITVCISPTHERSLLMLDPVNLQVLASLALPSGNGGSTSFGGGGYIYLDNKDQAVVPTADQQIWVISTIETKGLPSFSITTKYDLSAAIANQDASIFSALPDWSGRLWWVTDTGMVGYNDPTGDNANQSYTYQLTTPQSPSPQAQQVIGNSFAIDETGGVFIVSNYAMYRFDVTNTGHPPQITWCHSYDRGIALKTGQANFGSGTTPTLVGTNFCGITDNAYPRMHVVVYQRAASYHENRIVCEIPVFKPGQSATENSLIGYTGNFIVENNYGYQGGKGGPGKVTPGVAKLGFDAKNSSGKTIWNTNDISVPSIVSKLSLANGLLYTYSYMQGLGWSISALDAETGLIAYQVPVGDSETYDNHYSGLYIGPNGSVYVPLVHGMLVLSEGVD